MSQETQQQQNVGDLIDQANQFAQKEGVPYGVAWTYDPGQWIVYDLRKGCPDGHQPEFVCFGPGIRPIPLNETAVDAYMSLIASNPGWRSAA